MKYENFKQVKGLVEQIDKHKDILKFIDKEIQVVIIWDATTRLYTIGTNEDSEHEYAAQAGALVGYIKSDLLRRVENLHEMLEKL